MNDPLTFLAWLLLAALVVVPPVLALAARRRQRCECGAFKQPRAETCFDCSQPPAEVIELAERRKGRHAA